MPRFKRCRACQICPLPQDVWEFWQGNPADKDLCWQCRENAGVARMRMMYVPKLHGVEEAWLGKWLVPEVQHEALRTAQYGYITDGERAWWWPQFPGGMETGGLEKFLRWRNIQWMGVDRPPGVEELTSWGDVWG